jgi:methyl-accepting chemotaxis protein
MQDRSPGEKVWRQVAVRVVANDLTLAAIVPVWALLLGLADWRVYLGLVFVRSVVAIRTLRSLLEPYIRNAGNIGALDERQLLEVDHALQVGPRRFVVPYMVGWSLATFGAMALGMLGIPEPLEFGNAELLFAGLILAAVVFSQMALVDGLISPPLLEARASVSEQLLLRGLMARREPTSFVRTMTLLNTLFSLALFSAIAAIGGMGIVADWRGAELTHQQQQAELGALQVQTSGELPEELTIVEPADLPPILDATAEGTLTALDKSADLAIAAAPLDDGRFVLAQARASERLWQIAAFVVVFPLFFVPMLTLTNHSMVSALTKQLDALRQTTQQVLAAGNLRGIKRFRPPSNDEIGRLVVDFNGMLDVLDELAEGAHAVAKGNLSVQLERPGDLHDAFRGMLVQLRGIVTQIRTTALELASAAAELHAVTQEQERLVEAQSRTVGEVGSTVELLANAAEDITTTSTQVLENAERTLTNTDATVARISELNAQVGSITQLLEVIREVADRSDLLALNGSLEATRAGEAGRGFALVASEMRRLAERVAGSVADVRGRMSSISSAGSSTVMASAQSRELAERTAAAARQISSVTATQHKDTHRVSTSVHEVAASVAASAVATTQTRAAAERLRQHADELERLTRHFQLSPAAKVGLSEGP